MSLVRKSNICTHSTCRVASEGSRCRSFERWARSRSSASAFSFLFPRRWDSAIRRKKPQQRRRARTGCQGPCQVRASRKGHAFVRHGLSLSLFRASAHMGPSFSLGAQNGFFGFPFGTPRSACPFSFIRGPPPQVGFSGFAVGFRFETTKRGGALNGCGSKPMVPFWGRCTTQFSLF